tara:strand:+ start:1789 stop:2208 length:420 start_codon:yes stop_codon:yes gene_type:complete
MNYSQMKYKNDTQGNLQSTATKYIDDAPVAQLRSLTADEVKSVRNLAREIAKKNGLKSYVKYHKTGSLKTTTMIQIIPPRDQGIEIHGIDARVELCEALLALGYESKDFDFSLESHYLRLAREYGHTQVKLHIMKKVEI